MKSPIQPPNWIDKLLERYCDPFLWEGICGDLHEVFRENVEIKGYRYSSLIYFWQAVGFLRMKFKKKSKTQTIMSPTWKNYVLTSLRSIKRNKIYFGINLVGLVVALSCGLFASIYIFDEFQYDQDYVFCLVQPQLSDFDAFETGFVFLLFHLPLNNFKKIIFIKC